MTDSMFPTARVQLVDYRAGNLFSIRRALEVVGAEVTVVRTASDWAQDGTHVVLPGVGAYAAGMEALVAEGLDAGLRERVATGIPLLGICLGAQLLFEHSDEFGRHPGLGLLPGEVRLLPTTAGRVPHIGWAACDRTGGTSHPVLPAVDGSWMYFVHSFHFEPAPPAHRLLSASAGAAPFTAAAGAGNVLGVQFHPERSGEDGLALLRRFCDWDGQHA
jgi:imidazole glycerol-phosphate synthase subunit HisH